MTLSELKDKISGNHSILELVMTYDTFDLLRDLMRQSDQPNNIFGLVSPVTCPNFAGVVDYAEQNENALVVATATDISSFIRPIFCDHFELEAVQKTVQP